MQRHKNNENPAVGKKFQILVKEQLEKAFLKVFIGEVSIPIGFPAKDHKFDCASADLKIVVECKCYSWTSGGNAPSAKFATLNEAALYMNHLPQITKKIIAMKQAYNQDGTESLAYYYCRRYGHLLRDIEVWEFDENGDYVIVKG